MEKPGERTYWLLPSTLLFEPYWDIARQEDSVSGANEHAEAYRLRAWCWYTNSFQDATWPTPPDEMGGAFCLVLPEDHFPQLVAAVRKAGRKITAGLEILRADFRAELTVAAANLEKGDE